MNWVRQASITKFSFKYLQQITQLQELKALKKILAMKMTRSKLTKRPKMVVRTSIKLTIQVSKQIALLQRRIFRVKN